MYVQPPKYRYMAIATIQDNICEILMQQRQAAGLGIAHIYLVSEMWGHCTWDTVHDLPTTIPNDWLNSLTTSNVLHTAIGQMIIYVGTNLYVHMCHMPIIQLAPKLWEL